MVKSCGFYFRYLNFSATGFAVRIAERCVSVAEAGTKTRAEEDAAEAGINTRAEDAAGRNAHKNRARLLGGRPGSYLYCMDTILYVSYLARGHVRRNVISIAPLLLARGPKIEADRTDQIRPVWLFNYLVFTYSLSGLSLYS